MDTTEVIRHVCYRIARAEVRQHPFAHIYVSDIFPADYYAQLQARWPALAQFTSQADSGRSSPGNYYRERSILSLMDTPRLRQLDPFWGGMSEWLNGEHFQHALMTHFRNSIVQARQLPPRFSVTVDSMLVEDHTRYRIGPHTDAPRRIVSSLFYCPPDDSQAHLGTSLYRPNLEGFDPGITSQHYPRHLFTRVTTLPFLPNSLFAFVVGPRSFHGVEELTDPDVQRRLILHYVKLNESPDSPATGPAD